MAVAASGERSVAVGGNVYGPIVTGDNNRIVIRDGGTAGTLLDALGLRRRVRTKARRTPIDLRPPPFADRLGREEETAALLEHGAGRPLSIVGEALVGKTYLLRAALDQLAGPPARDGVVALYGGGRGLDDLLQSVWEAFFESRPPSIPSRAQLERDLADCEALVVVDSAELAHDDAQALAAVLPRSRLVLVSRQRRFFDGDEVAVRGLRETEAVALIERELGTPLEGLEHDAAVTVCRALQGHPLRIRRAAALVRSGGATLASLAAELEAAEPVATSVSKALGAVSDADRDLLAALAPFGGEPLGADLLDVVAGPGSAERAAALEARHLLVTGSPAYAVAADVAEAIEKERLDEAEARAVDRLARLADERPDELIDDVPPLLALMAQVTRAGRDEDVIRLGRAIAPLLVRTRRLGAWGDVAGAVLAAARSAEDSDALAWALHETGTHAVARDDVHTGRELLDQAVELRVRLGDATGAAASRHNLHALQPPWYLARVLHLPVIALLGIVVLLAAGGLGVAWLLTRDDDQIAVTTDSTTAQSTTDATTSGTTTDGTTTTTTAEPEQVPVEVILTGTGTVTSEPEGIVCPGACEFPFTAGTTVVLSAEAVEGAVLADWGHEGCPDPREQCAFEAIESTTVTPRFEPAVSLTVGVSGAAGSVTIEPPGTECDTTCTETLPVGTEVMLTATERDGSAFVSWSGGECAPVPTCSMRLDSPGKIAAVFAGPHTLTVTVEGHAGSRVTSSPAGIDCTSVCTAPFRHGTVVALTPVESGDGSLFLFWSGDCTGSEACELTVEAPKSVTARFNPPND